MISPRRTIFSTPRVVFVVYAHFTGLASPTRYGDRYEGRDFRQEEPDLPGLVHHRHKVVHAIVGLLGRVYQDRVRERPSPPSNSYLGCGSSDFLSFEDFSDRNHKETCAGCIVSLTTPTKSSFNAVRSVSSLSVAEKVSNVLLASYFLL